MVVKTGFAYAAAFAASVALFSLGGASPASAQAHAHAEGRSEAPQEGARKLRNGFWIGFGFGGGLSSQGSVLSDGQRGGAAYFRLGGTVNQHVLFGGEAQVWWRETAPGSDLERVNVTATALVYPSVTRGLFFKGGFGVGSVEQLPGASSTGVGTTLGIGYDFRLGNNFYITPNLDFLVQFLENSTPSSLLFTLGATWH